MGTGLEERGVRVGLVAVDHHDVGVRGLGAEGVQQALTLEFADLLVVEGDVGGDRAGGEAVVGDDLDALPGRLLDPRLGGLGVEGVEHDHLHALGDQGVELLLLLGRAALGVAVADLAVRAEGGDLGLDERAVEGLVAGGGCVLRQQQADGLGVPGAGAVLLVRAGLAAGGQREGHRDRGGADEDATHRCVHGGMPP